MNKTLSYFGMRDDRIRLRAKASMGFIGGETHKAKVTTTLEYQEESDFIPIVLEELFQLVSVGLPNYLRIW